MIYPPEGMVEGTMHQTRDIDVGPTVCVRNVFAASAVPFS